MAACSAPNQTIYSKACSSCGAPPASELTPVQQATRLRMAHQFLAATIVLAGVSGWLLPLLWPPTAIAVLFAASFYVALWLSRDPGNSQLSRRPLHRVAMRSS